MSLLVKVCGMRDAQNINDVANLNVDMVGFIFYERSPRYVGEEFSIPPVPAKRVGVFVNAPVEEMRRQSEKHMLDFVQLHGDETPEDAAAMQQYTSVIKAFRIDEHFDFSLLKVWEPVVNYFLFDTKSVVYGGTGKKFDWSLVERYKMSVPFLLSGGIGLNDVEEIKKIKHHSLAGVDVNSAFEITPAIKDAQQVKQFAQAIKGSL